MEFLFSYTLFFSEDATGNDCMCPYRKFTEGVYDAIINGCAEGITPEFLVSQMEEALSTDLHINFPSNYAFIL